MNRSVQQIYQKYKIMPSLATHMYRVAAVADYIADHSDQTLQKEHIIAACLLHDMGNIIKFDLTLLPDLLEPEGYDYWANVQKEFIKSYGKDEHEAAYQIARQIGVNDRVFELILAIGFSKSVDNTEHSDLEKKICCYSDHRTGPYGILPLEVRMKEGRARFARNKKQSVDLDRFNRLAEGMRRLEEQIFTHVSISPDIITDGVIQPYIDKISTFVFTDDLLQ